MTLYCCWFWVWNSSLLVCEHVARWHVRCLSKDIITEDSNYLCIQNGLVKGMDLLQDQYAQVIGSGEGQRCMVAHTCIIVQPLYAARKAKLRQEQQLLRLPRCCVLGIGQCGTQIVMYVLILWIYIIFPYCHCADKSTDKGFLSLGMDI